MLIAADDAGMSKARRHGPDPGGAARPGRRPAPPRRFNTEQRDQLAKRLAAAEERLPQQVTMAYRHLLLLGESDTGGAKLDHIDLGPARASRHDPRARPGLPARSRPDHRDHPGSRGPPRRPLRPAPRGHQRRRTRSAPGVLLPAPAPAQARQSRVLRRALAEGVEKGLFGLASGSAWDAEDAVLRFSPDR